jgi:hypothetical protein
MAWGCFLAVRRNPSRFLVAIEAGLSPSASYFSLLVQRKVTKRKHLPRQVAQGVWVAKQFSDSASCLDPKTAAIHGRRPFGVSGCVWLLQECEGQEPGI